MNRISREELEGLFTDYTEDHSKKEPFFQELEDVMKSGIDPKNIFLGEINDIISFSIDTQDRDLFDLVMKYMTRTDCYNYVSWARNHVWGDITYLLIAVYRGNEYMVRSLLERGCESTINKSSHDLGTPLSLAEGSGNKVIVDLLRQYGAI